MPFDRFKEFDVGLQVDGAEKAYPFRYLTVQTVVNDTLNGRDLVVAFESDGGTAKVFDRTVAGEALIFRTTTDSRIMTDTQTGTTWSKVTGEAVEGPLAGTTLESIPTFVSCWFAWAVFRPETKIYLGK